MFRKFAVSNVVRIMVVAVSIPLLAACTSEQRLSWSPDGKVLAVIGTDGLRISTDGGMHLSEPVDASAGLLSWFGDSKRLLVVSSSGAKPWDEVQKKIDKTEMDKIKGCARHLKEALEACNGNYVKCREILRKNNIASDYVPEALHYLRATDDEAMTKILGSNWHALQLPETQVVSLKIGELAKDSLDLKNTIFTTPKAMESAKVSPTNEYLSLVDSDRHLRILGIEQRDRGWLALAKVVTKFPDWDANTNVLYAVREKSKRENSIQPPVQELVALKIDYKKNSQISYEHLANVQDCDSKIRATASGDIYLLASSVGFSEMKKAKQGGATALFSYNLSSAKARKLYGPNNGEILDSFDVSPDGKSIVVSTDHGLVKILSAKDGKVRSTLATPTDDAEVAFAPVWKNNDELCYQHIFPNKIASKVELYSLETAKAKDISAQWPSSATAGVLNQTEKSPMSFSEMLDDIRSPSP